MTQQVLTLLVALGFNSVHSFRLAIAGAHGRLGRELVSQSLEKKWTTYAFVRRPDPIFAPTRNGWLQEDESVRIPIRNKRLSILPYSENVTYDALVISLSGTPFQDDCTDVLVKDICDNIPKKCKKVCLVSAYGVGDSLKNADVGIQAMNSWYLKDTYRSKRAQESIVCSLPDSIDTLIVRPRVLSFAKIPFNPISTTRQDLARTIIDWIS